MRNHQEKLIPIGKGKLFCRLFGHGDPIIVIHGAPMLSQDYLLPYMANLSENHFLVFYDQRGCGKSVFELNDEQINMPIFVEDIETIRKTLNLNKIIILGHSWGTFLSLKYTLKYPESVKKLILLDPMPASMEDLKLFTQEKARREVHLDELKRIEASESYKLGDPQSTERRLKLHFQTYLSNPNDIEKMNLKLSREAFLSGISVLEILKNNFFLKPFNIYEEIKNIQVPTLILHGEESPVSSEVVEHLHQSIPNSQLIQLKHCGHFPHIEQPESMLSAINHFVET